MSTGDKRQETKKPLTAEQKRARGYKELGKVNGVPVFLALRVTNDAKLVPEGAARDAYLKAQEALAMQREVKRQEAGANANGPQVFELTANGRFLCKQTGTRQWCFFTKAKLAEFVSKESIAKLRAFLLTMPDAPLVGTVVGAAETEDDE